MPPSLHIAMSSVRKEAAILLWSLLLFGGLILVEYRYVADAIFRRQLLMITGGAGLFVEVLLAVQVILKIVRRGLSDRVSAQLKGLRNAAIVAVITAYMASRVSTTVVRIRQQPGSPDPIDIVQIAVFSGIVIFGLAVLARILGLVGRKKG